MGMEDKNSGSAQVEERKEGFYFVKELSSSEYKGTWIIAKWNGSFFTISGLYAKFDVFDFEEIDERQICRN